MLKLANLLERMIPYQSENIKELDDIRYENCISELEDAIKNSKAFLTRAIGKSHNEADK